MTPEVPALSPDASFVTGDAEFTEALGDTKANGQIILRPAVYKQPRTLAIEGLLVRAETPLGTTIDGGTWTLAGNGMMVHGLKRRGKTTNCFDAGGYDNIIRRCDFADWVGQAIRPVNGHSGLPKGGRLRVDYCSFHDPWKWFEDPNTDPSRVAIRCRSKNPETFHYNAVIEHLHFHDFPPKAGAPAYKGQCDAMEPVPDGPSHPNLHTGWTVRYVLIERHKGKDAVIDIKAGGGLFEHFTILDSPGGRFDLRMGSGNTVRNLWLGNKTSMSISGSDHLIDGVMLDGGAIYVIAGSAESDVWERPEPYQLYQRPRAVTLRGVRGKGSIQVGHEYSGCKMTAVDTRIEDLDGPAIVRKLEEGTAVYPAGPAASCAVEKMTTALCGVEAPWPVSPPEVWVIAWNWPAAEPWFWKHNYEGLPDFSRTSDKAAKFGSEDEARACIDGPERPAVSHPDLLVAVKL